MCKRKRCEGDKWSARDGERGREETSDDVVAQLKCVTTQTKLKIGGRAITIIKEL